MNLIENKAKLNNYIKINHWSSPWEGCHFHPFHI